MTGLGKRALLATALHVGLLALFPLVRGVYAPLFRGYAELTVRAVDPLPGRITARFAPGAGGPLARGMWAMDTVVSLEHEELKGAGLFGASSFFHAYFPTTVLLALCLAFTPRALRERRVAVLLALALLHLFVTARCALAAYYTHTQASADGVPLVALGPLARRALFLGWHFAYDEMLANYLVPLALYGACLFGAASKGAGEPRV